MRSPGTTIAGVRITTPGRVLYPKLGLTKLDLVRFYAEIAEWALPHLARRPLTLVRCEHGAGAPDALRSECRFLPHSAPWHRWVPGTVRRVEIVEQKKLGEYLVIDSLQALLAIINGDILELHVWNAQAEEPERPDRLVFDLDPGPGIDWPEMVRGAQAVREYLAAAGLQSWVKTTGGKGLHVVVPFDRNVGWDACFAFARAFAQHVAREAEERFTAAFSQQARAGKILVDYKRNYRTSIAVAGFSTRARPHAPVSIPLAWEELARSRASDQYTVSNLLGRLRRLKRDPWEDYWGCRQRLPTRAAME
jgi:bifunctional non-homologous end joining protein LigD